MPTAKRVITNGILRKRPVRIKNSPICSVRIRQGDRMANKHYTLAEKIRYHNTRADYPGRFNLRLGSGKQSYSFGFSDAMRGFDNASAVKANFGNKAFFAYNQGQRRGNAEIKNYLKNSNKSFFNCSDIKK